MEGDEFRDRQGPVGTGSPLQIFAHGVFFFFFHEGKMASNVPFIKNTLAAGLRIKERSNTGAEDQFCTQCPSLFSLAHYLAYPLNFVLSDVPCQLAGSVASFFVHFVYITIALFIINIAVI